MNTKIKLLYFVSEDWYFWSHRRSLAIAALNKGYEVSVVTRVDKHGDRITQQGINLIPIKIERHGKNIFLELSLLYNIVQIYKSLKPDIVHHIAMKPVLYGTIAAIFSKSKQVVNAFPGMGYLFESQKLKDKLICSLLKKVFLLLFKVNRVKIIVQNSDNSNLLINSGICKKKQVTVIKGSGVDLVEYSPTDDSNNNEPIVLFASRLLWQKGIEDFVVAARLTHENNISSRFVIVGKPDHNNPNSVPETTLLEWNKNGNVEWWGFKDNMPEVIASSRIIVLPTYYGEGVPKILIEAAACAKPIITTDVPGCREIVRRDVNGFLTSVHDPEAIARYIDLLLEDYELCKTMGNEGRKIVESEFSSDKVNINTLRIYDELSAYI